MSEVTVTRRSESRGHVWGAAAMGEVADAWYASTDAVHMLVYSMAPGGWFGSDDDVRTVFDADQIYYVLEGTLALADPRTGEVRLVGTGDAAYVGSGTWTHGVACGDEAVRVLELVSPGLESEASVAFTRGQPALGSATYVRTELHGRWPRARALAGASATITVLREPDLLWRLEGTERVLTATWASTGRATVESVRLRPRQRTDLRSSPAELCIYTLDGRLGVRIPERDPSWIELDAGDGLHIPAGIVHRCQTFGGVQARFLRLTAA